MDLPLQRPQPMLKAFLGALFGAVSDFFSDWRRDKALKDAGYDQAIIDTFKAERKAAREISRLALDRPRSFNELADRLRDENTPSD